MLRTLPFAALLLSLLPRASHQQPPPPLVIVSMDGFRWESLRARGGQYPNFARLAEEGASFEAGMTPTFVSKTFPNHYSIVTGLYQESHGILGNSMYDAELNESFSVKTHAGTTQWFKGEPIWATAGRQGTSSAACFWPGTEAVVNGRAPTHAYRFDRDTPFDTRLERIKGWVEAPDKPGVILSYFEQPDSTEHRFGPDTDKAIEAEKRMDGFLGKLLDAIPFGSANLVVVSDHGMAGISPSRVLDLSSAFPDPGDYIVGQESPYLSVHVKGGEGEAAKLFERLNSAVESQGGHAKVYLKADIPEEWHVARSPRTGDVVALAEEGWSLSVTGGNGAVGGAHGYDNHLPSMRAVFFGRGPGFRRGVRLPGTFENVGLYPLFCRLMGIDEAPNNGTEVFAKASMADLLVRDPLRQRWEGAKNRKWLPARNRVSVFPVSGAQFAPGAVFDVIVTVSHSLRGAEPTEPPVFSPASPENFCSEPVPTHRTSDNGYTEWLYSSCSLHASVELEVRSGARTAKVTWSVPSPRKRDKRRARNVILMIGDGMSLPMITATRLLNDRGAPLPTDSFEYTGTAFTRSLSTIVTDSAAAATALNTGHKTANGGLGVYPDATQTNCSDNPRVETLGEILKRQFGMRVGVVTTAYLADATPTAVWGHCSDRGEHKVLLQQALDLRPEVILGGGLDDFDEMLLAQFTDSGYAFVSNASELSEARAGKHLLGVFAPKNLDVSRDRRTGPNKTQPSLPEMAAKALDHLLGFEGDEGFFLMVEAGSIDKQAHSCDYTRMLGDSLELQKTVQVLRRALDSKGVAGDTLFVVTSDHATGGYDVYGTVDTDFKGDRNTAIQMYGSAEWPDWVSREGEFAVENWETAQYTFAGVNVNHPSYREDFTAKRGMNAQWLHRKEDVEKLEGILLSDNIGGTKHADELQSAAHTASDVMVYATGAGADAFRGGFENTNVFLNIYHAVASDPVTSGPNPSPPPPSPPSIGTVATILVVIYLILLHVLICVIWHLYNKRNNNPLDYPIELDEIDEVAPPPAGSPGGAPPGDDSLVV